jgi:proteinaceous RNase P
VIDLKEEEWEAFAMGIAEIAQSRENKPDNFKKFMASLDKHGPYGILVDAANICAAMNVAFYGQNFESGGFSFGQVVTVVRYLQREHPSVKPLVVRPPGGIVVHPGRYIQGAASMVSIRDASM